MLTVKTLSLSPKQKTMKGWRKKIKRKQDTYPFGAKLNISKINKRLPQNVEQKY